MITAKELKKLKELQEKAKAVENLKPLLAADLEQMELNVISAYEDLPNKLRGQWVESWNEFCQILQKIADDNQRLIVEIRRYQKSDAD